jgi:hypothetical protein
MPGRRNNCFPRHPVHRGIASRLPPRKLCLLALRHQQQDVLGGMSRIVYRRPTEWIPDLRPLTGQV